MSAGKKGASRREFLASLLAVGATFTIGVPLAQASPSQIDDAWKRLLDDARFARQFRRVQRHQDRAFRAIKNHSINSPKCLSGIDFLTSKEHNSPVKSNAFYASFQAISTAGPDL